jgi:hypothetical protein
MTHLIKPHHVFVAIFDVQKRPFYDTERMERGAGLRPVSQVWKPAIRDDHV